MCIRDRKKVVHVKDRTPEHLRHMRGQRAFSAAAAPGDAAAGLLQTAVPVSYTHLRLAAQGTVNTGLLAWMMQDPYLSTPPPKTTGREVYGAADVDALDVYKRQP